MLAPADGNEAVLLLEHQGQRPRADPSSYIAPNATLCGDVSIGNGTAVLFGAVMTADGGPVKIGRNCMIMENAVIRGTERHPATVGGRSTVWDTKTRLKIRPRFGWGIPSLRGSWVRIPPPALYKMGWYGGQ